MRDDILQCHKHSYPQYSSWHLLAHNVSYMWNEINGKLEYFVAWTKKKIFFSSLHRNMKLTSILCLHHRCEWISLWQFPFWECRMRMSKKRAIKFYSVTTFNASFMLKTRWTDTQHNLTQFAIDICGISPLRMLILISYQNDFFWFPGESFWQIVWKVLNI